MRLNSLAFRLFATAAVWTILVLPIAGLVIDYVRKREIERAHDTRISQLLTLVIAFSTDHGGSEPKPPKNIGEPLLEITHSGWYWQITPLGDAGGQRLVSTSLASESIPLSNEAIIKPDSGNVRWYHVPGPLGEPLRVAETIFNLGDDESPRNYSYVVAGNYDFVDARIAEFRLPLVIALTLAGLGLLAATFFQVRFGLQPLRAIERGLADIRSGKAQRLDGKFPAEIEPLQKELNALITANQETIERARTQVGNLAHALKTPLAVIINEAREDAGRASGKIIEQAEIMRDQVNHYLDRARAAAASRIIGTVTDVEPVAAAIVRALQRIHRDRNLTFTIDCPPGARFLGEKQDLEEMLGNLLDNAGKWAKERVELEVRVTAVEALARGKRLKIVVRDDGPGLTPEQRAAGVKRGRRLDESKPGSGLGHSIVADLAQMYHGEFKLDASPIGGLAAVLDLPAG